MEIWLFLCTLHFEILKWIVMFSIGLICLKQQESDLPSQHALDLSHNQESDCSAPIKYHVIRS